jgi:glycine/D-amino acid oxidase-like deaminating enzyme
VNTDFEVIVVGGGAFGTNIAYQLTRAGLRDVAVVERFGLADGTTWHSGGFVGALRSHRSIMRLITRSATVYDELDPDGSVFGWRKVGSLRLSTTAARTHEFAELIGLAIDAGVSAELVGAARVAELAPMLRIDDLDGAVWMPHDGYVDPALMPAGVMAAAKSGGAHLVDDTSVDAILTDGDGVRGIATSAGVLRARIVVLATGFATPVLAATAGVFVPIAVSRQQYLVSEPAGLAAMPTVREPDQSLYFRNEGDAVLMGAVVGWAGIVESHEVPRAPRHLFDPIADALDPAWDWIGWRVPAVNGLSVRRYVRGPEAVTPDGELIAGATEVPGLWIAAGGSGHGIAAAGGLGWYLAQRIATGLGHESASDVDGSPFAVDRFPPLYRRDRVAMLRDIEDTETGHYGIVNLLR